MCWSKKEVVCFLGVGESTVRKWCLLLEESGYSFGNGNRGFRDHEVVMLQRIRDLTKAKKLPLEEAIHTVMQTTKGVKLYPNPEELLKTARQKNDGEVPRPPKSPLVLSYELTWRTDEEKNKLSSTAWRKLRKAVLIRDDYTCSYCGYQTEKTRRLHIHHVDGVPKNNEFSNLETICNHCHMILHSGLWAAVYKILDIYEKAKVSQEEVIRITRELREQGKDDKEIIKACGLKKKISWMQDMDYLKNKIGFVSSRRFF